MAKVGPHYGEGRLDSLGNRLATALLIVKAAIKGGGTLFPNLETTIRAEPGVF